MSATLIVGILPLQPRAEARDLRLALFGCSLLCVLMWMTVSVRSRRAGGVDLDKPVRPARRPSRSLPVLLAVLRPLASGAALVQAVGPDGEPGRWVDEYAADVVVTLRFDDSSRRTILRGARTLGVPAEGDTVTVMYAPGRPGLGGRYHDSGFFDGGAALLWIWAVVIFSAAFGSGLFGRDEVHSARRFRGDVHGVAALVLCLGVLLLLPGAFFQTSTWAGWLLALVSACTPWLALTWVIKRV
ncbi:hypothetical protein [Streptomyces arboris]|uniref:DUF3592 domain-containing protein n=1 Tax=Streptomyces arboris TaxID=2600619 RepID=A0A5N5EHA2_9ACTN|nr:hypothetical protein [Streptomyces arboris]KAB2588260.1 hypothetical protein F5983_33510 [Streptomyces arboris]